MYKLYVLEYNKCICWSFQSLWWVHFSCRTLFFEPVCLDAFGTHMYIRTSRKRNPLSQLKFIAYFSVANLKNGASFHVFTLERFVWKAVASSRLVGSRCHFWTILVLWFLLLNIVCHRHLVCETQHICWRLCYLSGSRQFWCSSVAGIDKHEQRMLCGNHKTQGHYNLHPLLWFLPGSHPILSIG